MHWLWLLAAFLVILAVLLAKAVAYRRTLVSFRSDLKRYAEENRLLQRAGRASLPGGSPPGERIILFGDAIAENWEIGQDFPELAFLNRGIAGETTLHMLARFQQDVLSLRPRIVILLAGRDDLVARLPLSATQDHLQLMTRLAARQGIELILSSLLPVRQRKPSFWRGGEQFQPSSILAMNAWMRECARENGLEYADFHSALADADGWMRPEFSDDGVRPNSAAYRAMAAALCAVLERILERAQPSRSARGRAARD